MAQKQQEFFVSPSKLQIKGQKIISKECLRKVPTPKKIIESSQEQGLQEQIKAKRKATRWWNRLNSKYFDFSSQKDVTKLREQLMTDKIFEIQSSNNRLGTYFSQEVAVINPNIFLSDTLRILFRRQIRLDQKEQYILVSYALSCQSQNQVENLQNRKYEQNQDFVSLDEQQQIFKKTNKSDVQLLEQIDKNIHLLSFKNLSKRSLNIDYQILRNIKIEPIQIEERQQVIFNLLKYQTSKRQTNNEIQREIKMWENQFYKILINNNSTWKCLMQFFNLNNQKNSLQSKLQQSNQILKIKEELLWSQVLLYIKTGHSDKTEQMLNGAMEVMIIKQMNMKQSQRKRKNTKIQKLKCLFQTDCKVCFSTESDDKNKVFYCDKCNTSFHQSCYGIKNDQIEQGKPFYCDVCNFLTEEQKNFKNKLKIDQTNRMDEEIKFRKPRCQICTNTSFPMKRFDNHFYHVTCLFLFGYVKLQNFKLQLKENVNHSKILQEVIENEIQTGPCESCSKFNGNKFKCKFENCQSYYHPICAYLNGERFQIQRNFRNLNTSITCSKHIEDRNLINQVYIRRFFCDYKNTSNTSQQDFKILYQKQLDQRQSFKQKQKNNTNKLLRKWKMVKIKIAKNDLQLQRQKSSQMDIDQIKSDNHSHLINESIQ